MEGMDGDADWHGRRDAFIYLSLADMMSNEMEFGRVQAEKEQTMMLNSMQESVVNIGLMRGWGGGWMDGWVVRWNDNARVPM